MISPIQTRPGTEEKSPIFFLVIFREPQMGVQQRLFASVANLMRFMENEDIDTMLDRGSGPFDVFYIDIAALEIAPYDLAPLRALMKSPGGRGKAKR